MFLKINTELLHRKDYVKAELLVLGFLDSFSKVHEEIKVSNETIADYTGLSTSSVVRSLKTLSEKGDINLSYSYNKRWKRSINRTITTVTKASKFFMLQTEWITEMNLSSNEAFVLSLFYSVGRYNDTKTLSGFKVKDIAETLNMSLAVVNRTLKLLDSLKAVKVNKVTIKGHQYNEYELNKDFFFCDTREERKNYFMKLTELFESFLNESFDNLNKYLKAFADRHIKGRKYERFSVLEYLYKPEKQRQMILRERLYG